MMAQPAGFSQSFNSLLEQTRSECINLVKPRSRADYNWNVTECILEHFTELEKAFAQSRQYILTLWPAFVGAICAMAPDPCVMVYDNVWWSLLFAMTCGGLPGSSSDLPPHHLRTWTVAEGIKIAQNWQLPTEQSQYRARGMLVGPARTSDALNRMEWACFAFCGAFYVGFCTYFAFTIHTAAQVVFGNSDFWMAVESWYWLSPTPAIISVISEIFQDRIVLFHPAEDNPLVSPTLGIGKATAVSIPLTIIGVPSAANVAIPSFTKVDSTSSVDTWTCIIRHQWDRTPYRVLVKRRSNHWLALITRMFVGIGRIALFAYGSVIMGDLLLVPGPNDVVLFAMLLLLTAIPRQLWTTFWTRSNRGADLVVYVREAGGNVDDYEATSSI